jgi:hypothetical protein
MGGFDVKPVDGNMIWLLFGFDRDFFISLFKRFVAADALFGDVFVFLPLFAGDDFLVTRGCASTFLRVFFGDERFCEGEEGIFVVGGMGGN